MATSYLYLSGTAGKFVKLRRPDEKYGKYELPLHLDEKSWTIYRDSGLRLLPKQNEDGPYLVLRCPTEVTFGNKKMTFGPVPTLQRVGDDVDGKPVYEPLDKLVGAGSTLTAEVEVYDSKNGKGHRLKRVLVHNLLEYVPKNKIEHVPEVYGERF